MKKIGKFLIILLQISVCAISLFYVFRILLAHFSEIHFYFQKFNYFYFLLAFVFLSLSFFVKGAGWSFIIKHLEKGKKINYYSIYFLPQIMNYAPGGIWSFLGSLHLAKKEGASSLKTLIAFSVEFVFTIFAGAFLYILLAFFDPHALLLIFYLAVLVFLILALVLWPSVLTKIINFALLIGKKAKLKDGFSLSQVIILIINYFVYWIFLGLSLVFLVFSLYSGISFKDIISLINFNTVSWIVAFVAPFVAGGLGVMEIILFSFLKNVLPISLASFIPLGLRLLNIFSDLFVVFLVYIFQKILPLLNIDNKFFNFLKLTQRK